MSLPHHGTCLCGAVSIAISAAPMAARMCWCRVCQALGGGSATVNVCFPAEKVAIQGEVRWHASVADSGTPMRRGFCPACGTPLFSVAETRPHLIFVRAGALEDPGIIAPEAIIWTSAAPRWARFDPDVPQYAAQLPPVA